MFSKSKTIPDPLDRSTSSIIDTNKITVNDSKLNSTVIGDSGSSSRDRKPTSKRSISASATFFPKLAKKGHFSLKGRKNEDRIVSGTPVFEKDGISVELNVVIDGHGGNQTANFLEHELPRTIKLLCLERADRLDIEFKAKDEWKILLKDAFANCSDNWDQQAITHSEKKAGAVVTLILVSGVHCVVAHVGDGKVLASWGNYFRELTFDHRADNPAERARIEASGGCVVNNRVRGVLAPSRAFGDLLVRTDVKGQINNSIIRPDPQLVAFDIGSPGFVVLGTDGLFDVLPGHIVTTTVALFLARDDSDPTAAAKYLAEQASSRTDDDISVIVLMWT